MPLKEAKPSLGGLRTLKRRSVRISSHELVKTSDLEPGRSLPLLVEPAVDGVNLIQWVANSREFVNRELSRCGGILCRGFRLEGEAELEDLVRALSGDLLEYTYRSTPRSQVSGRIYTSTEYPADQSIPLHNEMSYSTRWPLRIWFFSMKVADEMGETPIADSRRVFERLSSTVRQRFIDRQVMYVRNYGGGLDLTWQNVFQTDSRSEVEAFCQEAGIELEWRGDDQLRTRQICQSVARHPQTGEMVWFNQAHLFHVSSLPTAMRETMLAMFAEDEVPRNAYYGDGSPIEESVLAEIRHAYDQESVIFPWQKGDVLLLDNMLAAHGRRPFEGSRKVVVGMAESCSQTQLEERITP